MTRTTGPALAAGGVLMCVSYVLRDPDELAGAALIGAVLTSVLGVLLVLAGLHAALPSLRVRAGRLGWIGAGLFLAGLPVAELPMTFVGAAGEAGESAEEVLMDQTLPFALLMVALLVTNLGLLLLGAAVARAESLPTAAGLVIAIAPVAMMTLPDFAYSEALALGAGFLGLVWLGLALRPAEAHRAAPSDGSVLVQ
jgi:hypothetical protein